MNLVILTGRLTRSPEFKDGEHPYTRFSLAVDRQKEGTDFINCVAFEKTAESVHKWLSKGTKVVLEGHIQTGSYKREGKKVTTFDVVVHTWEFAQSKTDSSEVAEDELPWN